MVGEGKEPGDREVVDFEGLLKRLSGMLSLSVVLLSLEKMCGLGDCCVGLAGVVCG